MYVIRALSAADSVAWAFVSKEKGHPFTWVAPKARMYKTYSSATRAMEKLRLTPQWSHVGDNCEVSKWS